MRIQSRRSKDEGSRDIQNKKNKEGDSNKNNQRLVFKVGFSNKKIHN